ncbi:DUF3467 domain-containing protein [Candidatus Peregrinibacteria bacterium]|nr:DUF3467 domain-containing protein [Candidatus Peregrinibacteria bacterium]
MNNEQNKIQIKFDADKETGVYANAVSVNMNKNEMVLDFGYILPNVKPTTIKVVSRINLSHQTAENLLKILSNAVLDYKNKQKEANK